MRYNIILAAIITLLFIKSVKCINENSTLRDYAKCQEQYIQNGYNYLQFYKIEDIYHERDNVTQLNLNLGVLATQDAHILLSEKMSPGGDDPVYEIVLGAGANTFCEIRKFKKRSPLITKAIKNVLSPIKPTPINIKISTSGKIEVFIIGQPFPLLSVNNPNPITINYLSFTSWGTSEARWFFDCPNEGGDQMTKEDRPLNAQQKLEKLIIDATHSQPSNYTKVVVHVVFSYVNYLSKSSVLDSRIKMRLWWIDPRASWDEYDYGNIKMIRMKGNLIWIPNIVPVNGKTSQFGTLNTEYDLIVFSNGTIEAISHQVNLQTWCTDIIDSSTSWPNDLNNCEIIFGSDRRQIEIIHADYKTGNIMNYGDKEWKVQSIGMETKNNIIVTGLSMFLPEEEKDKQDALVFNVQLYRNQNLFSNMFYTPLIVFLIILMLSFWIENPYRMGLTLIPTFALTIIFAQMFDYAPLFYVPTIMKYYNAAFIFSWLSVLFIIITSWLRNHPPQKPPPSWILSLIDSTYVRVSLALEQVTSFEYLNASQRPWIEVSTILSRIMFIITGLFLFAILINGI